ncbi:MAG: serine hydrolase [Pirellulaceae bacterium]|nr:serine hydrolase [Pirellulaceae bacterium]
MIARALHLLTTFASCLILLAAMSSDGTALDSQNVPGRSWNKWPSPTEAGWSIDKLSEARAFCEALDTAALMIIHDGVIVDEWGPTDLPLLCHSVRKSLLSALYGRHVESGRIDLDKTMQELGINDNEPSLTDTEQQATIRDVLKARSGIYHPALYETAAMAAARPARSSHDPNTFWYYNNWDFNVAGSIFQNRTGRSVFEEFEDRLAIPLQMEDFSRNKHTKYVTGDDSVHPAYPFELSARDLARVGLLFLRGGRWKEQQLVPKDWVRESTSSYSDAGLSGGYGYMWWVAADGKHFPNATLPDGSFSARGVGGQYLLVIPAWNIVICHRVNTFLPDKKVSKDDFGKLLSLIFAARPTDAQQSRQQSLELPSKASTTVVERADLQEPAASSRELAQRIEKIVSNLIENAGIPGLSIAIGRQNQIWLSQGYGQADVENSIPATAETKYRTASIAKSLTAVVLMSLVEEKSIDLDANIRQYCTEYPRKEWPITSRQLLGHLGGVRHYKNSQESSSTKHFFDLSAALATFREDPLLHEPGIKYLYSSFGYNLLGSVAEGARKRSFVELLHEKIIVPAEMSNTVVDDSLAIIPNRSRGYIRASEESLSLLPSEHRLKSGELYNAALHDTSMKIPGGGLLSTASDLVRFVSAVNTGRLLQDETRDQMWTTQKTSDGTSTGYGLGWKVEEKSDRKIVSHTGSQSGTSTVMLLVPKTGTSVAIMCNLQHVGLTEAASAISVLVDKSIAR